VKRWGSGWPPLSAALSKGLCKARRDKFAEANMDLAVMLAGGNADENKIRETLKARNITFKSGRHFWKTMMNAKELGEDIEEVFGSEGASGTRKKIKKKRKKVVMTKRIFHAIILSQAKGNRI
jgi:hypothetical protein